LKIHLNSFQSPTNLHVWLFSAEQGTNPDHDLAIGRLTVASQGNLRYYETESGKNVLGEINAQDVTNVVSKAGTTDFDVITPR